MLTGTSKVTLDVPRDRAGTFDPKLIAKYQRRFPDFDDKIVSMYARGMTMREIRGHVEELYGIYVSPDLMTTSDPEAITRCLAPYSAELELVGFEAGPLSEWLFRGQDAGIEPVLMEPRQVRAALSAMVIKTDRNDARAWPSYCARAGSGRCTSRPFQPASSARYWPRDRH